MTDQPDFSKDPVRMRRAQIAHAASLAQRIGYLLFAVAVVIFFVGFFGGFTGGLVTAIVAGYAVKAAERDDLENGR